MNVVSFSIFFSFLLLVTGLHTVYRSPPPNIVFILADDLGWNDVGFHGSNDIQTPNIDALAYTGIILNNYYVAPVCSPSRSALMTGKYPIHTGLQHGVIGGAEPYGLSLNETLLPNHLKERGYITRAVGKWHLGSFKKEYTPEYRGFNSHYGYWTGHQDYFDHTAQEKCFWGLDMRRGMEVDGESYGKYSTDIFTEEAVKVIAAHDVSKPLFLYLAHLAVHSGNGYQPLEAPEHVIDKFSHIPDKKRRTFAAMLSKLDDSVGEVVKALQEKNMLKNSIIVFSTDNGGPAAGFNSNAASNWPLRGVKDTMWEGGVRGSAFIWSPLLPQGEVSDQLMHISDWLPTLLAASRYPLNEEIESKLDGINMWGSLRTRGPSLRKDILLNIDAERKVEGYRYANWKVLKGNTWKGLWNGWYGPSGRKSNYKWRLLYESPAAHAFSHLRALPSIRDIQLQRAKSYLDCPPPARNYTEVEETYLFNLSEDPCELNNLASSRTDVLEDMEAKLDRYRLSIVQPRNQPVDWRANPKYWGYTWTNWMDLVE